MEIKLLVVAGETKAKEVNLRLPTVIGRGTEANLTLPHPLVSRQHCEIYEQDGNVFIRDLGSLNGTFVADERIEDPKHLERGQLLTIGAVTFRAQYGSDPELSPPGAEVDDDTVGGEAAPTVEVPGPTSEERAQLDKAGDLEDFDIEGMDDAGEVEDVEQAIAAADEDDRPTARQEPASASVPEPTAATDNSPVVIEDEVEAAASMPTSISPPDVVIPVDIEAVDDVEEVEEVAVVEDEVDEVDVVDEVEEVEVVEDVVVEEVDVEAVEEVDVDEIEEVVDEVVVAEGAEVEAEDDGFDIGGNETPAAVAATPEAVEEVEVQDDLMDEVEAVEEVVTEPADESTEAAPTPPARKPAASPTAGVPDEATQKVDTDDDALSSFFKNLDG